MLGQQKDAEIKVTGNVQDAVNKLNQVHKQIGKFEKSMAGVKTSTGKAGQGLYTASGQFEKFTKATKKATEVIAKPKGFANQVAGLAFIIRTTFLFSLASIGITAINKFKASIGQAVVQLMDFELQLAEINTLLDISDFRYQQLRKTLRGINKEYRQSMEVMTRGAYDLISAGVALENLEETLRLTAMAATAGLTDLDVVARASIATINSYKLAHEDLEHVLDLEFQTVKLGVLVYQDVADNIGVILPAAVRLGVSLEDLHASFATLTKAGLGPAMAATALSRAFDQLMERSEALKKAGIPIYDEVTGKFRGMAAIIDDIRVKIGRMTDEQRAWFFDQINFEIRAGRAMSGLVSQYDTLVDSIDDMYHVTGQFTTAFDKMADTSIVKLDVAKDKIGDLAYEMKNTLIPPLVAIVELFAELAKPGPLLIAWVTNQTGVMDTTIKLIMGIIADKFGYDIYKEPHVAEYKAFSPEEMQEKYIDLRVRLKTLNELLKIGYKYEEQKNVVLERREILIEKLELLERVAISNKVKLLKLDILRGKVHRPAEDPAEVERMLKISKLQDEYDKKHKKNLDSIRLAIMATGIAAKDVFDLSEDELLILEKQLKIQEEQKKLWDKYLKTKQKLISIGITKDIILGTDLSETTLSFLTSRYNKAASLIHKWQIILIDQGYKLQDVIKMTYYDAVKLEELEEKRQEQLRKMERDTQYRMREAEQAINFVFVDPMQNAFDDIIYGTERLDKAFSDMIDGILKSLARLMFSRLLQSFVNFLIPTNFFGQLFGYATGGGGGAGLGDLGGGGFGKTVPNIPSLPSQPNSIVIVQNISVNRMLPHTEETLRRFSNDQQTLALKEAAREL